MPARGSPVSFGIRRHVTFQEHMPSTLWVESNLICEMQIASPSSDFKAGQRSTIVALVDPPHSVCCVYPASAAWLNE